MKQRIDQNSKLENFPRSRLVPFTQKQIEFIQGTSDFFGLNHYSSKIASSKKTEFNIPSYKNDVGVLTYQDSSWPNSTAKWLKVVPWGFRKLLNWINKEYGNPEVYITENGFAEDEKVNDLGRIDYHKVSIENEFASVDHDCLP